jgi:hypothetical protein
MRINAAFGSHANAKAIRSSLKGRFGVAQFEAQFEEVKEVDDGADDADPDRRCATHAKSDHTKREHRKDRSRSDDRPANV